MKRRALLIGNTHGLNGVQVDIEKTARFLQSQRGGRWFETEIERFENPKKDRLLARLEVIRREEIDYAFVLFSGHGGHARQTILELNGAGETILESQLSKIATRQLTIHDCCRVVSQQIVEKSMTFDSAMESLTEQLSTRRRYESRIMQAIPQQVRLYACRIGECSIDTAKGAVYLGHLLDAARALPSSDFTTVESAHSTAASNTTRESKEQHPEADLPKCLTSQQLIIALR